MSVFLFREPFSPPPVDAAEKIPFDSIVEQSGFQSTEQMVNELIRAGERLQEYRRGLYNYTRDVIDDEELVASPLMALADDPVDLKEALDGTINRAVQSRVAKEAENAEVAENHSSGRVLPDNAPARSDGGSGGADVPQ